MLTGIAVNPHYNIMTDIVSENTRKSFYFNNQQLPYNDYDQVFEWKQMPPLLRQNGLGQIGILARNTKNES